MKEMNSYRLVIRPTAFDDGVHDDAGLLSKQEKEKKRKERKEKRLRMKTCFIVSNLFLVESIFFTISCKK